MHRIASFMLVALAVGLSVASLPAHAATLLWANVNSNGSLARGEGATSAERLSEGTYIVTFSSNVSKCNYGISLANYGIALTKPRASDKSAVFVAIVDSQAEGFQDTPFYLQVVCR